MTEPTPLSHRRRLPAPKRLPSQTNLLQDSGHSPAPDETTPGPVGPVRVVSCYADATQSTAIARPLGGHFPPL
eukprot:1550609-Prorocentrum_lima.AAC.1